MSDSSLKLPATSHRKRTSTPRSKTGCVTCKIRRLKCGEEKPSCFRCIKSGWQCDGYTHVKKTASRPSSPPVLPLATILPRKQSLTPSPTPSLHKALDLDDRERLYFHNFIDDVSIQLPSHDSFFWRGVALQESHTTFTVRHAIVAIGALAKSSQRVLSGVHRVGDGQCAHREFALHQYQKAIQGLRRSITTLDQEDSLRTTLVSCLVLAFFDNFVGNGCFALQHVRYTRDVLCKLVDTTPSTPPLQSQDNRIAKMFLRLDMESFCAMGTEANRTYITLEPRKTNPSFPSHLNSIEEALVLRNRILWEGYDLFYRTSRYQTYLIDDIPVSIVQERNDFIEQLRLLNALLDVLAQSTVTDFNAHPLRRAEALKLPSAVLLIRLSSALGIPEPSCDHLLPEFSFLLEICNAALEYEKAVNPEVEEGELFSFDVRVIAALSLVSTKCGSSRLRRRATNLLLSTHRREWMYDSLLAGKVAAWMMSLEEEAKNPHPSKATTDITYLDWYNHNDGTDLRALDPWNGDEVADMMNLGLEDEDFFLGGEVRAWGPVIEWDVQDGRRAKVRCRQNFRAGDGSISWCWRETDIEW